MSTTPFYLQKTSQELEDLYRSMQSKALLRSMLFLLGGRSRSLLDITALVSGRRVRSRHYAGTRTVPIRRIKGSEGRSREFDRDFNPLHGRTIHRWISVAIARSSGTILPPVELIQVGEDYFVRDGHHRISVARAFGEQYMDAEIIVLELEPASAPRSTPPLKYSLC